MLRRIIFSVAMFSVLLQSASADVQVTTVSDGSSKSVIKLSKTWAKVTDLSDVSQYMLIDMKNNKIYVVDNNNKMVITMEDMEPQAMGGKHPKKLPKIEIKKTGDGPNIAGFKTTVYQLTANGEVCSEHYISKDLLNHAEVKMFSDSMQKQLPPDMGMEFDLAPCEIAETQFDKMAFDYGAPLLSKDSSGNTLFETTEIKVGITFPDSEFALPKGYPVVSQKELMEQMMRENMPEEGDDISPESLRHLEEMMKRGAEQ